jgi:hypothetical protein
MPDEALVRELSGDERLIDPAALLAASRGELARLPGLLGALVGDLEDGPARLRPAPCEWAPIEILCHLRDEETEDFGARLRAVLEGRSEFAPIDPEGWVEVRRYRDSRVADALSALYARRESTLDFLAGLDAERLRESIPHARFGRLSGLDILAAWVAHDRLHLSQLTSTLAKLWATRWGSLRVDYAGPIPYTSEDHR